MESNYLTQPIIFLIDTLVYLYFLALVLRILLQYMHADFYNPISQFLVKITHPPIKFLRHFVPSIGKIDTATIVFALGLQMTADFLIYLLRGDITGPAVLFVLALAKLVTLMLDIFVFSVFARTILSWFNFANHNQISTILFSLTEPLLIMCRKVIPNLIGIDLSPLAALLILQLAKMMLIPPLYQLISLIN